MKVKLATVKATIQWLITTVVDRVLHRRDERNFDRGMLAGLETAENAVRLGLAIDYCREAALDAIREAREGYRQEMATR